MIETIVAIAFIFVLMTLIIFFIMKNTVDIIKEKGKLYFALKLQEYEDNKNEEKKEETKENSEDNNNEEIENNSDKTIIYVERNHGYEVDDILKIAKAIDKKFIIEPSEIIINFIEEEIKQDDLPYYDHLIESRKLVNEIGIYNILISSEKEKKDIIKRIENIDKKILKRYFYNHTNFDICEFMNFMNVEIDNNDPTVYVLVGEENDNYDYIDSRIKTIYKQNIYKGIKIIYKNTMYDYSLS